MKDISNFAVFNLTKRTDAASKLIYGPVSVLNLSGIFFYLKAAKPILKSRVAVYESDDGENWTTPVNKGEVRYRKASVSGDALIVSYIGNKQQIQIEVPEEMEVILFGKPQAIPENVSDIELVRAFKNMIIPVKKRIRTVPDSDWTPDFDCTGVEIPSLNSNDIVFREKNAITGYYPSATIEDHTHYNSPLRSLEPYITFLDYTSISVGSTVYKAIEIQQNDLLFVIYYKALSSSLNITSYIANNQIFYADSLSISDATQDGYWEYENFSVYVAMSAKTPYTNSVYFIVQCLSKDHPYVMCNLIPSFAFSINKNYFNNINASKNIIRYIEFYWYHAMKNTYFIDTKDCDSLTFFLNSSEISNFSVLYLNPEDDTTDDAQYTKSEKAAYVTDSHRYINGFYNGNQEILALKIPRSLVG